MHFNNKRYRGRVGGTKRWWKITSSFYMRHRRKVSRFPWFLCWNSSVCWHLGVISIVTRRLVDDRLKIVAAASDGSFKLYGASFAIFRTTTRVKRILTAPSLPPFTFLYDSCYGRLIFRDIFSNSELDTVTGVEGVRSGEKGGSF